MELITLKTFDKPIDANILKSKLESEGIECVLFDENVIGMNPMYSLLVGGVKLKIREEDLEKANTVLSELESIPFTDENDKVICCPKCGSDKITTGAQSVKSMSGVLSFITGIIFLIFPPFSKTVCQCKKCGAEFDRR